ncbi:hypothetical protein ACWGCC_03735 [Streptomyces nigrescens]
MTAPPNDPSTAGLHVSARVTPLRRLRLLALKGAGRYLDAIDTSAATRANPLAAEAIGTLDEARRTASHRVH